MQLPDNPQWLPPSEVEKRRTHSFVQGVEQVFSYREKYAEEMKRAEELLLSFGGVPVTEFPLEPVPPVMALLPDHQLHNHEVTFFLPDQRVKYERFLHAEHDLQTVLDLSPDHRDFWESYANGSTVDQSHYDQKLTEDTPGGKIILDEDTFQVIFLNEASGILQSPDNLAAGLFRFDISPPVISRAWNVYVNACTTRGLPPYFDLDTNYVGQANGRIAIEFSLANPKHGRPVVVKI